jgi:hypothetical protein
VLPADSVCRLLLTQIPSLRLDSHDVARYSLWVGDEETTQLGYGRVEVAVPTYSGGQLIAVNQYTICDDGFQTKEAEVVCRSLGLSGGSVRAKGFYGVGNGDILMDNVRCNGGEMNLFECSNNGLFNHNCQPYEDVAVVRDTSTDPDAHSPPTPRVFVCLLRQVFVSELQVIVLCMH